LEDLGTEIDKALKEPLQMTQAIKFFTPKETQNIIKGKPRYMIQLQGKYWKKRQAETLST
jgi:hypothetical protein